MKLLRYGLPGMEKPGMLDPDGHIRDLSNSILDVNGSSLCPDVLGWLTELDPTSLPLVEDNPRLQARMNENIFDVIEGLQPLAKEKGCTLSQLALAWCVQQPGVTSPIIGPRTMAQLEDNCSETQQ